MSSLHVDQLRIARGGHPVITEASFDVPHGTTTVIVGPSGSGKSTLLSAIAGLINVDGGTLQLDDREITYVPTAQRNIGLVFQDNQLFPHLNVADNVAYGLRRKGIRRSECDVRVSEVLELVGLEGFGERAVGELSGGEAKRIALARSLAPAPELLLLDEPLTGLDDSLHDRLLHDLVKVLSTSQTTAIWVTHHRKEAERAGTQLLRIHDGVVSPELTERNQWHVQVVSAADTFDLRRRVLRDGTRTTDVNFDGDETAIHLAVSDPASGEIIAISSWFQRNRQHQPINGLQLRGMASHPNYRGQGAAQALLRSGIELGRSLSVDEVWARARDTALNFYLAHGFVTSGPGYIDDNTGLAHHDVVFSLR